MAESRIRLLNHLTIHGYPRWFADKSRLTDAELAEFHRKEHEKDERDQDARQHA